jgi:hypothetical protein
MPRKMIMSSPRPVIFSMCRTVRAVPDRSSREVTGAVADDGHGLLGKRSEHQFALLAVRQHLPGERAMISIEVVLPDVQPILGLDALL